MFKHLPLFALMAAPLIEAHYGFSIITKDVAGKSEDQGRSYEFIRNGTRKGQVDTLPLTNINDTAMRCNLGGEQARTAKTFTAEAGTSLGFKTLQTSGMHPGPASVYMSKAPAAVSDYDGSGDWFKIHEESIISDDPSLRTDEAWTTFGKTEVNYTIPKDVPDGEYLIRVEHIGIQNVPVRLAEFYVSCAQIKVTGGGTGTPEPLVKIPGYLNADDPGLKYDIFATNNPDYRSIVPGPDVWPAPAPTKKSKIKRTVWFA